MINGQLSGMKLFLAVLAFVFVPQKDISTGKGWSVASLGHIVVESNDTGQWNFQIGRSNGDPFVHIHDGNFAAKNGFDSFLPVTDTQGQIGHWLKGVMKGNIGFVSSCHAIYPT